MPITPESKGRQVTVLWARWHKTLLRIESTLAKVRDNPSPHGEKWRRKMTRHWAGQVTEWEGHEPQKYED